MDIYNKFKIIESRFKELDNTLRKEKGRLHFDTKSGIWGPSSMLDIFEFFMKIKLNERDHLLDLGSGDGRIVMIASLFTNATGMETESTLNAIAEKLKDELQSAVPDLAKCTFLSTDYTKENIEQYDTFFIFADHSWNEEFEKKLMNCKGILYSYHNIFSPKILKKGKTVWVQQIPIISYPLASRSFSSDKDKQD